MAVATVATGAVAASTMVPALTPVASATSNSAGTFATGENTFYAYVGPGETLDTSFVKRVRLGVPGSEMRFRVTDAAGTVLSDCVVPAATASGANCSTTGLTGASGVWTIEMEIVSGTSTNWPEGGLTHFDWDILVSSAAGAEIPGRVWTEKYRGYDDGGTAIADRDVNFWVASEFGALYEVQLNDFDGGGWAFDSDAFGVVDPGTCTPAYESRHQTANTPEYSSAGPACGDKYKLFFEPPAPDLPASAPSASGTEWIRPGVVAPAVENLAFAPDANTGRAGTFEYDLENFTGTYELQIDVDGDGVFDGPLDRVISLQGTSGQQTYAWDGLDANGAPVPVCQAVNARVAIERTDEIHFVLGDAEGLGGLRLRQLEGNAPGNSTVYWDDRPLQAGGVRTGTTPVVDGRAGYDSWADPTGVHPWTTWNTTTNPYPWGNQAAVDNWAFSPVDVSSSIALSGACLEITKTSDATEDSRVGDTVTYTVTATNTGTSDFTAANPAVVTDDLSGVLDDATFDGVATADRPGPVSYAAPLLSWTGPLAVNEVVTITYDVVLTEGGDGVVRNVAFAGDGETPQCDPPTEDGLDPDTGVPCAEVEYELPRLSIDKSADTAELPAIGEPVTYTIVVTNEGPGDYTTAAPATFTDDLADVLDDATIDAASVTASVGTATYANGELSWSGVLTDGQSATITYTVTYTGEGDNLLVNRACVPEDQVVPGAPPCDVVQIPGSNLGYWKSSNPASGSTVNAGQDVTYTVTFRNDGESAATVDAIDDLSDVLDDADLVAGPTVSDPVLSAAVTGTDLSVTGSLPAGATVTVTYTVRVKAWADQADHVLGNVVTDDGGVCLVDDCTTEHLVPHLTIDKTSDAAQDIKTGDTVTYTVRVTNDGAVDYTATNPARAIDDLTGVIDDATYNDDATPTSGTVSYTAPTLTWTGPLAVGQWAEFTYTVTVTNAGDHVLENTASLPPELCTEDCDSTVITPLPHVVPDKTSDPASGEAVEPGQVVTYTLTFHNDGQAPGAVDSTDDLSDILDDADITSEPVSDHASVTATRTGDQLRIVGTIDPGETATITYQVTIKPDGQRGDNMARNVLTPDVPILDCTDDPCEEVPPPTTEHPIGQLDDWKTVDPASGTTVKAGQEVTYTLHFTNTGEADVEVDREDVLTGVLDDADITVAPQPSDPALTVSAVANGRFQITGTLAPDQTVTVTYTVLVRADGQRGDDRLGNFIVDPGEEPPTECVPEDPQRPDCTVNHVSSVTVVKSSDPESGTKVEAGQDVTYTLTFTNTSTNDQADAQPVDYTDHMADVLDDATLTAGPTAQAPLTAVADGDNILITGELASGQTATVTYTVKVKDAAQQGNRVLGNVVALTGTEPICSEGSPLCTSHEIPPEPTPEPPTNPHTPGKTGGSLATTGATLAWVAGGAALLTMIGALTLIIARNRRTTIS